MVNGQTASLYRVVGGVASGPALGTYSTTSHMDTDGVFFFDGLADGDYIVALTTASGILYSTPTTVNENGDGWILGNSQYINSVSALGQTGFVCGASTVVTPTTPATPFVPSLSNTGFSQMSLFYLAGSILALAMAGFAAQRAVLHLR